MGEHKHFKIMGFLNILPEAEIHATPKSWVNSHIMEQVWENTLPYRLRINETSCNPQCLGMYKFT